MLPALRKDSSTSSAICFFFRCIFTDSNDTSSGTTMESSTRPTVDSTTGLPPSAVWLCGSVGFILFVSKRTFIFACKSTRPWSNAVCTSSRFENILPSPITPARARVIQYSPSTISWVGVITGLPFAGESTLFVDIISILDSSCASTERGT